MSSHELLQAMEDTIDNQMTADACALGIKDICTLKGSLSDTGSLFEQLIAALPEITPSSELKLPEEQVNHDNPLNNSMDLG